MLSIESLVVLLSRVFLLWWPGRSESVRGEKILGEVQGLRIPPGGDPRVQKFVELAH